MILQNCLPNLNASLRNELRNHGCRRILSKSILLMSLWMKSNQIKVTSQYEPIWAIVSKGQGQVGFGSKSNRAFGCFKHVFATIALSKAYCTESRPFTSDRQASFPARHHWWPRFIRWEAPLVNWRHASRLVKQNLFHFPYHTPTLSWLISQLIFFAQFAQGPGCT